MPTSSGLPADYAEEQRLRNRNARQLDEAERARSDERDVPGYRVEVGYRDPETYGHTSHSGWYVEVYELPYEDAVTYDHGHDSLESAAEWGYEVANRLASR